MLVDLGGGTLPHPRADVVIDLHHPLNSPSQDATVIPWQCHGGPWEEGGQGYIHSGLVDEVYSSHFMEHIHHGQPLLNVMNESWRVLKSGGTFTAIFPTIGHTSPFPPHMPAEVKIGWQPWADPTHVSFWWLPQAFDYFCEGPFKPNADYGMKTWAPMGSWVPEEEASEYLNYAVRYQAQPVAFWSIRDTWEGVVRILKP